MGLCYIVLNFLIMLYLVQTKPGYTVEVVRIQYQLFFKKTYQSDAVMLAESEIFEEILKEITDPKPEINRYFFLIEITQC